MKELVDAAHAKGMKVILDWVANHTSWDNAWVTEHPDWYTQDANGNVVQPQEQPWADVADLNFDNEIMQQAMIDAMKYWVTEIGIDGYRCDYAEGVPDAFWKKAIAELRTLDNNLLMLAEGGKAHDGEDSAHRGAIEFTAYSQNVDNSQDLSLIHI